MIQDAERQIPVLVTDFDGTMTYGEFYRVAKAHLVPPETPDYWEEYLQGRMTHFEALRRIFAHIRLEEAAVVDALRYMDLDPEAHSAVSRLQHAGWQIEIASAGCDWYIRRLLAEQRIHVRLHANPGSYAPEYGLQMQLPVDSPFCDPSTGISKQAVVAQAIKTHDCVAFAGDGRPDQPAAMLVPPERRFARGWLADEFTRTGIPFRSFARWSEIADMLLAGEK